MHVIYIQAASTCHAQTYLRAYNVKTAHKACQLFKEAGVNMKFVKKMYFVTMHRIQKYMNHVILETEMRSDKKKMC